MGGAWKQQPDAGVRHLGTLSEQMSAVETTEEIEGDDAVDESSEAGANADAEGSAQSGIADGSALDGLPKGKGSKPSCLATCRQEGQADCDCCCPHGREMDQTSFPQALVSASGR